ncbi:hypothetical protein [[Actinomadura] parvosata]|nr:hypothetical protein [Nonomuraea sp. ATCC 55076]
MTDARPSSATAGWTSWPPTASARPCTGDEFRRRWAQHNVRLHHTGTKSFRHPAIGGLTLDYESMDLHADPGLNLTVYTAAPDTPSHDALRLLATWAATTLDRPQPQDTNASHPRG